MGSLRTWTWLSKVVVLCAILASPNQIQACDKWPLDPGTLVREYVLPNGLTNREYDTDGDSEADYGTATQPGQTWPLFYARGFDDHTFFNDAVHPFVASVVWQDRAGKGICADITIHYIRENRAPFSFDLRDRFEIRS